MSLTSGPITEAEAAGEKLADHIGSGTPGLIRQILDALAEYQFVFRLEKKQ